MLFIGVGGVLKAPRSAVSKRFAASRLPYCSGVRAIATPPSPIAEEEKRLKQFKELCYHMGLAFVTWQDLENAHFNLFFKMCGATDYEIASVLYYHSESFEARHRLLGYVAQLYLRDKPDSRKTWENNAGGLKSDIKNANSNRNKIAHYAEDYDLGDPQEHSDGSISFAVSESRLRPSAYNVISRLQGRTSDNPEHDVSVADIRNYVREFRTVTKAIEEFRASLPVPPGASLTQSLGLPPRHLMRSKTSQSKDGKEGG